MRLNSSNGGAPLELLRFLLRVLFCLRVPPDTRNVRWKLGLTVPVGAWHRLAPWGFVRRCSFTRARSPSPLFPRINRLYPGHVFAFSVHQSMGISYRMFLYPHIQGFSPCTEHSTSETTIPTLSCRVDTTIGCLLNSIPALIHPSCYSYT